MERRARLLPGPRLVLAGLRRVFSASTCSSGSGAPSVPEASASPASARSAARPLPWRIEAPSVPSGSMALSSMYDGVTGHSGPWSGRSVSEWAPQPWSRDTTRPSSIASSLAHTPKT